MDIYVPNPAHAHLWGGLLSSWTLSLEADGKSARTIENYTYGPAQLHDWLQQSGRGTNDMDQVTPQLVREWLAHTLKNRSDATAAARYKGMRQFCNWLLAEREVAADPMANVRQPAVKDKPTPIVTDADLDKLLASCASDSFTDVRDRALLMLFADTGMRLGAVAGMKLDHLDLRERVVAVVTKGDKHLLVPFGANTARTLDKYLRARRRLPWAHTPWVWLSANNKGHLTNTGIYQLVRRRGRRVLDMPNLHPHMFRHKFADTWLEAGGSETGLMDVVGWKSRQMVGRYAAVRRAERARAEHRRLSPMDNR